MELKIIARIRTDFPEKFGIPRQSGLIEGLTGRIVFEPAYRTPEALRGIEGFSYLWLLWGFSKVTRQGWSATVAPPRLGGRKKMGVFATRSPYRPNPVGLSSVRLLGMETDEQLGTMLLVGGIDMLDGTPIYD
ncbi:MAG: tRNA (N6-threonylcarbamoyladenosine(37)-N6)-methyltransferase TrmO, partial [Ruminococcaceae bacterium]|nr:tRNA (N6-threonylcarbamoyladenosine(37)-N6)-methyltransferase TrmO [Oscillospiraceae bacterium]